MRLPSFPNRLRLATPIPAYATLVFVVNLVNLHKAVP